MAVPRWLMRGRDEFGITLAWSFAVLLIAPFELHTIRPVIMALLSGLLLFTLWTTALPRPFMALAVVVTGIVTGLAAANEFNTDRRLPRIVFTSSAILVLLAIGAILVYRLSSHVRINVRTICGALSLYVLIGLTFTYADVLLSESRNERFFAQPGPHSPVDYLYFSFATITTVGYGDLSAADDPARMFAVVEALLGQTYLVSVVALVVGNIGWERRRAARPADSDPERKDLGDPRGEVAET